MSRLADVHGVPIVMGRWYWCKGRTGQVSGVGKFAATISRPDDITFFINGVGYSPEGNTFVQAAEPSFEPPATTQLNKGAHGECAKCGEPLASGHSLGIMCVDCRKEWIANG